MSGGLPIQYLRGIRRTRSLCSRVTNRPASAGLDTGHEVHLIKRAALAVASLTALVGACLILWANSPKPTPATTGTMSAEEMVSQWDRENSSCRGSTKPEALETRAACERRGALDAKLNASGWCYGRPGQYGYEMKWELCASQPAFQEPTAAAQDEPSHDDEQDIDVSWVKTKEDALKASKPSNCYHNFVPIDVIQKLDAFSFLVYTRFSVGSPEPILLVYQTDSLPVSSGRTILSPRAGLALAGEQTLTMESGFDRKVSVLRVGDRTCARLWSVIESAINSPAPPSIAAVHTDATGSETVSTNPAVASQPTPEGDAIF